MIEVICVPVGYLKTNCYIFHVKGRTDCVVVDPGDEPKKIFKALEDEQVTPSHILLTHSHFDHIYAIPQLVEKYPDIKVVAYEKEKPLLEDMVLNGSKDFHRSTEITPDILLEEGEYELAGAKFKVIHTPGHTTGSVSFYFYENNFCFTGDTLFQENIGRSDWPTGNSEEILNSISQKLFALPDETDIFPGHGPATTIKNEKANNPYFR